MRRATQRTNQREEGHETEKTRETSGASGTRTRLGRKQGRFHGQREVSMKYLALFSVVVAIGVFANLVSESKMLSYLSSDPKVCINCHTMNVHYDTWQHSSHRNRATCVDCHLPRDSFVNKMLAKARDGYHHSLAMTF